MPVTIYYAFKQSETAKATPVTVSTGWETFLDAVIRAGFGISWHLADTHRTRGAINQLLAATLSLPALSWSAVRVLPNASVATTRREFQEALRTEFPQALTHLQRSNIAPVDLAQASIGPGMAVFTSYREVLNADGSRDVGAGGARAHQRHARRGAGGAGGRL